MNKKQSARLAAMALAVAVAISTISPVTAFAGEAEALQMTEEETALPAPEPEETAAPEPAADPTDAPEPTADPAPEPEPSPEPTPEQTPEPSATPEPIYTLSWDNAAQIEEQSLAAQQAAEEAAAQGEEPPEAEIDPALAAVLASEAGFPAGSRADARLLKEEELDAALQSLADALTAAAREQDPDAPGREAAALLPLWLGVLDAEGGEQPVLGEVAVTLTVEDTEALRGKELYHQTADDEWEKLDYTLSEPDAPAEETDAAPAPGSVTFAAGELGVFLFVETADALPEEPQEPAETEYIYEDDTVLVRALVPQEAAFPANVTLHADALAPDSEEYRAAYEALAADLQLEEGRQLVFAPFEVYFLDEDGAKLEPEAGAVRVEMQLKTDPFAGLEPAEPDETVQIAHLKDDGSVEYLPNEGETPEVLAFETPSFSILGPYLIATVYDVQSISIDSFDVSFSSGADKTGTGDNIKYVWNPTDPASGHDFVYRLDYIISGTYANGQDALQITLPLHILKDRDGNWADKFDCPYLAASEVPEGEQPDFVYEINEEENTVTIYNYKGLTAGEAGYIEFSYTTTKSTLDYEDMVESDKVTATLTATGSDGNQATAEATASPVCIDTHATINYTQKQTPTYYTAWQGSWGETPSNADDYYYLVWPVHTYINKNTQPYNFSLEDTFTDYGGEVVGYRFAGQSGYTTTNTITNQRGYGDRYDYVLTRYKKADAEEELEETNYYEVHNSVTATVDPVDQVDADTTAQSSKSWYYQKPEYVSPTGHFWAEKYGIYGKYNKVTSSQNVSDYTLEEFLEDDEDSIDNLRYYTYAEGYPYPWTLGEDATDGGYEDALNGLYGQKTVDYDFIDDTFYLEGVSKVAQTPPYDVTSSGYKLTDADYDLTGIEWEPILRTATFDETELKFVETSVEEYKEEDAITIWVRTESDTEEDKVWVQAAVYDLRNGGEYKNINETYIQSASGQNVTFQPGVKGVRFTCTNAYYHTRINLYPIVSLKRTDNVLNMINPEEDKIRLTNEATFAVTQNGESLFGRTVQGTDYIQKVERHSSIKKDITATRNDKLRKQYTVTWRVKMSESYTDNDGDHYVPQESGTFYDLAPAGAVIDLSSVSVTASGQTLSAGSYTVTTTENYKDSGRTLLTIAIAESTSTQYVLTYSTNHQWNAIQDYGKNLLNSVAYETGNDDLGDGLPNNGGSITDKDLLSGLGDGSTANKYLYAEARYDINITMAANTGLLKQVKGPNDTQYSYSSTVGTNGVYSYQIRLANDDATQSEDIIFFDSLEYFYQTEDQGDGEANTSIRSDWYGTLISIDLAAMRKKGVAPVVYLSAVEGLNPNLHHDLADTSVWLPYEEFVKTHSLADARAVAVDATTATGGGAYRLAKGDSLVFTLYLQAPASDETNVADPTAYNNIYVSRTGIAENEGVQTKVQQFFHQDYTEIRYRVTGDLHLLKVSSADGQSPVQGATFLLRGTSDYGTVYETRAVTARNGTLTFEGIEKGSYELLETACTDDWQLNTELYNVTVNGDGSVTVNGLTQTGTDGAYLVEDEPRIHADLVFDKLDSLDANKALEGVEFRLSGASDYDNDVLLYAESDAQGRVRFENIELGTYTLAETKTLDGYIQPQQTWVVKVDERGVATLYEADGKTQVATSDDGYFQVKNEPLHKVQFVKSSSYGVNIYLEGAVFTLSGVSDYGADVEMTATSTGAFGMVTFDGLEPGTYTLQETEAPADHELDATRYTVKVYADGSFEILGMETETVAGLGDVPVYNIKNDRTGGTVEVTKVWEDDKTNAERDWIPVITISTGLPSKDPNGYSITFDANDGSFDGGTTENRVVYADGTAPAFGTSYKVPTRDGYTFLGWYTADEDGTKYEFADDNGTLSAALTEDVTLYAQWQEESKLTASYAVQLYGICVDTGKDDDGNDIDMGLTFGPALGATYYNDFKAHTVDETTHVITGTDAGTTNSGNAYRCLHYDDWETITEWNITDPYVYEKCIANKCTHSVVLNLNNFSGANTEFTSTSTGDGPTVLWDELTEDAKKWTATAKNTGDWGASNVRAMLNGKDTVTTETNLTEEWSTTNCLLAAFPQELQNAIGARATKYDTTFDSSQWSGTETTYDKLWLFSPNEISSSEISGKEYNHPSEALPEEQGTYYQRWSGCELSTKDNNDYRSCYGRAWNDVARFWLRSGYWYASGNSQQGAYQVLYLSGYGGLSNNVFEVAGIAPGFSLARPTT